MYENGDLPGISPTKEGSIYPQLTPVSVIVEQPKNQPPTYRDWHDGLCDCGNNCGNCWLTALCYPCVLCNLYQRYKENCCTPCCVPFSDVMLNIKHRSRHRIVGSVCSDFCTFACCAPCALCRLYRDMAYVESVHGSLD